MTDWRVRIAADPQVLAGKPTIRGTRIAVDLVVDLVARGYTKEQILEQHDLITDADIQACLAYAAETLHSAESNLEGLVGCTKYKGPAKSLEEMEDGLREGARERSDSMGRARLKHRQEPVEYRQGPQAEQPTGCRRAVLPAGENDAGHQDR